MIEPMSMDQYSDLVNRARKAAFVHNAVPLSVSLAQEIVDAVITGAKLVGPVPELRPETECSALLWDADNGNWQVCDDDPGHAGGHDNSEWSWDDSDANSVPTEIAAQWAQEMQS